MAKYSVEVWRHGELVDVGDVESEASPAEVAGEIAGRLYGSGAPTEHRNCQGGVHSCLVLDGGDIHASIYVETAAQDRSSSVDIGL